MTNQPTDNEWIEKARQQYSMCMSPKRHEIHCELFKQAILSNLPKPTEVVALVDIEDIIEKIWYIKRYSDTRYFDWEEVKKELKKLIIDNIPQSISREAVEKLREKYKIEHEAEQMIEAGDVLEDLDALLNNPQDDTN